VLLDIILVNLSIIISLFLRFSLDESYLRIPVEDMNRYYSTAGIITFIFIGVFYLFKLYSSLWRYASINELISIVGATAAATALSYISCLLFEMQMPRSIYIISWMLIMLSI